MNVRVGDKIRYYSTTSNQNEVEIDFTSYEEGIVEEIENPFLDTWHIWFRVKKSVFRKKPLPKESWRYGHLTDCVLSFHKNRTISSPYNKLVVILNGQLTLF